VHVTAASQQVTCRETCWTKPVKVDLGMYVNVHGTDNQTYPNLAKTHTKIGTVSSGFKGGNNIFKVRKTTLCRERRC
jgi:hypothetical protein